MKLWDLIEAGLTARELAVAYQLLEGKSNKDIALNLGVTSQDVNHHLNNISKKFDIGTTYDTGSRVKLAMALWGYSYHGFNPHERTN